MIGITYIPTKRFDQILADSVFILCIDDFVTSVYFILVHLWSSFSSSYSKTYFNEYWITKIVEKTKHVQWYVRYW